MASRARSRVRPVRYQLNKHASSVLSSGHPWIFRKHMSSAVSVFADGQWLRLVDGANKVVGHGFYQREGAIAIRVLSRGPRRPDGATFRSRVESALAMREPLRAETNAYRAVHGEGDELPAVTADVYDRTVVVSSYAAGADPLGRLVARHLEALVDPAGVLFRAARRRVGGTSPRAVVLRGKVPEMVHIKEGGQSFQVPLRAGQKSGAFLDLRGLRRFIRGSSVVGKRVLDLFSYTGSLGLAAASAGASEVWHVDRSSFALDIGRAEEPGHRWIEADAFRWLPELDAGERFDLAIVDPPQMTSRTRQVENALRAYDRLYRALAPHVLPGGAVFACCCTSRIDEARFKTTVGAALGAAFTFVERLEPEIDHPVRFPEADYLKVLLYRRQPQPVSQTAL